MNKFFYIITGILVVLIFLFIIINKYDKQMNIKQKKEIKNTQSTIQPSLINGISREPSSAAISLNIIRVNPSEKNSIQNAVDKAMPGDVIELSPGEYFQDIITKRDGMSESPIVLRGPKQAVLKGTGGSRVLTINHSYITLDGFTIDGLNGSPDAKSSYRDKLIYAIGIKPNQGPSHLRIINMSIKNAGGECVRLRYFSKENEIAYNTIGPCGAIDYIFNGGGKNGEGIYIGTAPEQRSDKKNPDTQVDQSNNNHIHHNTIDTQGNECVDIKEGSSFNVVEYNTCTGQKDPESGGLDSRGNNNVFRFNTIQFSKGAGIRLGGDDDSDGINNDVYQNTIINNALGGIKFQRTPQGRVCGNEMKDNETGNSVGQYGEDFTPDKSC